jgi:hypothetical protein
MHRGSSKGGRVDPRPPEILPLSASPPPLVRVEFVLVRAAQSSERVIEVPSGTLLRAAVHLVGHSPEGAAVLDGETPLPMDTPLTEPVRLTLVPTFSGG